MKKLFYLLPILALLVSCNQDEQVEQDAKYITFSQVSIDALMYAGFDNTITTANLADFDVWGHNDDGVVFEGTKVEKQGDTWVSAVEKMWEHSNTYHFHAFAPSGLITNIGEYPNTERTNGLSNFTYTNDGAEDLVYAYATRTQGSPRRINDDPVQLAFEHLLSRVQFTFKNSLSEGNMTITDVQITEATKSAELNCADASIANWAWTETSTGAYNFGAAGTIAQGASAATENVQFLFPATARDYNISFNFVYESDAVEARTATIANVNLVMGKAYNINVTIEDKDIVTEQYKIEFFVAEVKDWGSNIELDATMNENTETPETPENPETPGVSSGMENGYAYVDLGLSVKWATCNVGATKPEDYGDYFAWGETTTKETYNWSTYKYCVDSYNNLTKYCNDSEYGKDGFTDTKTVLDPEDDAATANWGGAWRMPTKAEQDELRNNCTWTWTTQNGVNGYLVTSNVEGYTDKSIFLPAAGCMHGGTLIYAGSYGDYWSSSLTADDPIDACRVYFYSDYVDWCYTNRDYGQSVRPVCK